MIFLKNEEIAKQWFSEDTDNREIFSIDEAIELKANTGLIFISVSPKQADLYIDDIKQKENSGKFNLIGNNHLLSVKARGYQTQSKKVNISTYSKNISFIMKKNIVRNMIYYFVN